MKRLMTGLVAVLLAGLVLGAYRDLVGRAESTSSPIVGSWRRLSGESGVGVTNLYTFFADGTAISTDRDGVTWLGAWEHVGEDAVAFTLEAANADGSGMGQTLQFVVGPDSDEIQFGPDVLQRIVADS